MKTVLAVVAGAALSAALAFPCTARANVLFNGSLESPLTPNQYGMISASATNNRYAITGWTITAGAVDVIPNTYWQSSDGNDSVDLIGTPGIGSIAQNVRTVIGDTYTLTFDLAFNPENLTFEELSTKHLVVTAWSNPGVDATQTYSGTAGLATKSNMMYMQQTFTFTANSTLTTLSLAAAMPTGLGPNFNADSVYCGPVIDNLDLEDTGSSSSNPPGAPEPASLAILGMGGLAMLRRPHRRRA